jgi:hypothetical protein
MASIEAGGSADSRFRGQKCGDNLREEEAPEGFFLVRGIRVPRGVGGTLQHRQTRIFGEIRIQL